MRLIDADKIEWEYKCISKEEIDEEKTVNAIPWQSFVELTRTIPYSANKWDILAIVKKWFMENDDDFRRYWEEQKWWEEHSSRFD